MITVDWTTFNKLVHKIYEKLVSLDRWKTIDDIYGIPRGGVYVALLLGELSGKPVTNVVSDKTLIVDDIVDSGSTLNGYKGRGLCTAVLYIKSYTEVVPTFWAATVDSWVKFPWEGQINDNPIQDNVRRIIEYIGENPNAEGLKFTPQRVARMWDNTMYGIKKKLVVVNEEQRNTDFFIDTIPITIFKCEKGDLLIRKTSFISFCMHHMVPFFGEATVGIIPNGLLMGMNKIDRVVKYFAARLQIQEVMGNQIVEWIMDSIKPKGAIVVIKARHLCAEIQGDNGQFTTSAVRGIFLEPEHGKTPKDEFLSLIGGD